MTNMTKSSIANAGTAGKASGIPRKATFAAAALAVFAAFGASCSGSLDALIKADGSATVALSVRVPDGVAAKIREHQASAAGAPASSAPLFDAARFRKDVAARTGVSVSTLSLPDSNSIAAVLAIKSLKSSIDADFAPKGIAALSVSGGVSTLKVTLDRSNADGLNALVPGLDPDLLAILNPPSLEDSPVTKAEYRLNLVAILGEKNAKSIDTTAIAVSIKVPGKISASSGAFLKKTADNQALVTIPLLDLLVLESPIVFSLSWK